MHILFSPVRRDDPLELERQGDTLVINGEPFDFSGVPAGATLPGAAVASTFIAGDVERDAAGVLTIPLVLPHGPGAPPETRFPAPVVIKDNGPVPVPPQHIPDEEPEDVV